jgi:hypothetical protein
MSRPVRSRLTYANVIASLALFVALGGGAYAATKLPANSVTSAQVKNGSLLAKDFKSGQLPRGKTGPAGPSGPAGPGGAAGAPGSAKAYATITGAGAVDSAVASKGITVSHPTTGWYCVSFDPALGISSSSMVLVFDNSIAANWYPIELRWASTPTCPAGTLGVITYKDSSYTAQDQTFEIVVL